MLVDNHSATVTPHCTQWVQVVRPRQRRGAGERLVRRSNLSPIGKHRHLYRRLLRTPCLRSGGALGEDTRNDGRVVTFIVSQSQQSGVAPIIP